MSHDRFCRVRIRRIMMRIGARHDATISIMRTTVNLDADIEAEVARLQREQGLGLSEAINTLARRGATRPRTDVVFTPVTFDMGLMIDVADTQRALELLDDLDASR
jgi:hypothetical protein